MKNTTLFFVLVPILLFGCSKYGSVSIQRAAPPIAMLPPKINTIAVVNRSLTLTKDKSTVESILTGEVAGSDRLASDKCLLGVYDRINYWKNNTYYWNKYIDSSINIVVPANTKLYGSGTRETPQLLDWKIVKKICDSTHANALLVLETFDSNSDLIVNTVVKEINAVIATGSAVTPTPPQQIKMNVVSFWRMYDPATNRIVDEFQNTNFLTFTGTGRSFAIPPANALPQTAYASGEQYIERFLPNFFYVTRQLYKKGKGGSKQKFKMAFRKSAVADWLGASEIWQELTKSSNRKNAGKACLNLAVACEVLGKYDEAIKWASKAYADYGNKLARDYVNQLRQIPNN